MARPPGSPPRLPPGCGGGWQPISAAVAHRSIDPPNRPISGAESSGSRLRPIISAAETSGSGAESNDLAPRSVALEPRSVDLAPRRVDLEPRRVDLEPRSMALARSRVDLAARRMDLARRSVTLARRSRDLAQRSVALPVSRADRRISPAINRRATNSVP